MLKKFATPYSGSFSGRYSSRYSCCYSAVADITSVSRSNSLPLRYNIMTSLCGPFVGSSSPVGGTRVPSYYLAEVVVTCPGRGHSYALGQRLPPPTPTRS